MTARGPVRRIGPLLRRLVPAVLLALALVGCGENDVTDEPTGSPTATPTPTKSVTPNETAPPESVVDQAVADLAARLDLDPAAVTVVDVEEVTWSDGSLGCAEPGVAYTQALVDGSRITLLAADRQYEYHAGASAEPALCEKPTE